uniref:Uncharacterized protein n=1 Tax=Arundo donax TaxID=35708 RepID=A0A0A8XZ21_ARUDO
MITCSDCTTVYGHHDAPLQIILIQ